MPKIFNDIFNIQFVRAGLANTAGFADTPLISSLNLRAQLKQRAAPKFNLEEMKNYHQSRRKNSLYCSRYLYIVV